jgi:AbrB family looped-hinge helix DNA binding protein
MTEVVTRLGEGGRVVIPASLREAVGLEPGDKVVLVLRDGEIALRTARQGLARAQSIVRRHVAKSRSLAEELIRDRRRESRRG